MSRFNDLATEALRNPALLAKLKNDTAATLHSFGIDDPHAVIDVQNALDGIDVNNLNAIKHLLGHLRSGPG
ncbi:MAG TPA: hypothetical protein VKV73_07255 [Chloroflexota bacterium]|nr:hypothetical protein [Chloroflexota bacterium]